MLMRNPEFKRSACCILIFTIIVANSASGAALEGQLEDRSTNEMEDWRQSLPTAKRAMALLNKLVMAAHRATKKEQDQKQYQLLSKPNQSPDVNEAIQERQFDLPKTSAEINDEDYYGNQKVMALPRIGFERRGQKSHRVFWRCYFNAVSCFR